MSSNIYTQENLSVGRAECSSEKSCRDKDKEQVVDKFSLLVGNHKDFLDDKYQDDTYEYAKYLPSFPDVKWEPLQETEFVDRGHNADPKKRSLLDAAIEVDHLTPLIGTELSGIDLRYLTDKQKNDLALLVAERGVVFFRNQDINMEEQMELSHYFGPPYVHPSAGFAKGLPEVHVVYTDSKMRLDSAGFAKRDAWHTDVAFEVQPPGLAILKLLTVPPVGADTIWGSCTGLYSLFSPQFQEYLEKLEILQSSDWQAQGARAMGWPVRREPIQTIHPMVRVHPVTGWKSIFANAAFTTRIAGVPKSESDSILRLLFREIAENPELHVRFRWKKNDVAIWDNRTVLHTLIANGGDFVRHGVRVMNQAERPLSVTEYEKVFKKIAKDRKGCLEVNPEDHNGDHGKESASEQNDGAISNGAT